MPRMFLDKFFNFIDLIEELTKWNLNAIGKPKNGNKREDRIRGNSLTSTDDILYINKGSKVR